MLIINQHTERKTGENQLIQILKTSELIETVLLKARDLGLQNYYIGAGCIAQTVWNHKFNQAFDYGIKDIDIVYFDQEHLDAESENELAEQIKACFKGIDFKIDVKNQARVHLWYADKFGKVIQPYTSLEKAIDSWPTTATSLGIRYEKNNDLTIYAPYGLEDLLAGIVRANKVQITQSIYEAKVSSWQAKWPELDIIYWME